MNKALIVGTAAAALSALGWSGAARAADCKDLNLPNPLIVSGSTAVGKLVDALAKKLAVATGDNQITILNPSGGSCSGVALLQADTTPAGACAANACVSKTGVTYYDSTGAAQTCDLKDAHVDLILSDVFKESCPGDTSMMNDTSLLALPFEFIVPTMSDQVAIDAREAYYAYGTGMTANITPWNSKPVLFQRDQGSGTQITIFKNIHIPVTAANGTAPNPNGSGGMVTGVSGSTDPQHTLGFVSSDFVVINTDKVKRLAYRHWDQNKFYWADSTSTSTDKQNVRDGHYPLWSYEHAITLKNAPNLTRAQKVADIMAGKVALAGTDTTVLTAQLGFVPVCAMEVSRTADAGDFTAVTSGDSCSCLFEKNAGPAGGTPDAVCNPKSGTTCTTNADCSSGRVCRSNFCEAR